MRITKTGDNTYEIDHAFSLQHMIDSKEYLIRQMKEFNPDISDETCEYNFQLIFQAYKDQYGEEDLFSCIFRCNKTDKSLEEE